MPANACARPVANTHAKLRRTTASPAAQLQWQTFRHGHERTATGWHELPPTLRKILSPEAPPTRHAGRVPLASREPGMATQKIPGHHRPSMDRLFPDASTGPREFGLHCVGQTGTAPAQKIRHAIRALERRRHQHTSRSDAHAMSTHPCIRPESPPRTRASSTRSPARQRQPPAVLAVATPRNLHRCGTNAQPEPRAREPQCSSLSSNSSYAATSSSSSSSARSLGRTT